MEYHINYNFSTVAVGEKHINHLLSFILDPRLTNHNINILTDKPEKFSGLKNITTVKYTKGKFSFNDKKSIIKNSLQFYPNTVFIDSDQELNKNITEIPFELNIQPGIHTTITWKHPAHCSLENLLEGNIERVKYGKTFREIVNTLGIDLSKHFHIQESFFVISKHDNLPKFFKMWDMLQSITDFIDQANNQRILGYGEGYSIGISSAYAEIPFYEHTPQVQQISSLFKHKAWM